MLTAHELQGRAKNLASEQAQRLERDKQRLEKEKILEQRRKEREEAREQETRRKRLDEIAAVERAERYREELTEHNRGVFLSTTLQAVEANDAAVKIRGIRRSADKVSLPASLGHALMEQEASKNKAMLFELHSLSTGRRTHVGVLDFTAPEGIILLPKKVRECLFAHDGGVPTGMIELTYKRLEKGTFVRFQPLTRGFHEVVGDDVRAALEGALVQHSTLTKGDTLEVEYAGQCFTLSVAHLEPHSAVSVLDTEVEAEVVASVETEELIQAWEAEQQRNAARLSELRVAREAAREAELLAHALAQEAQWKEAQAAQQAAELQQEQAAAESAARRAALESALAPEPAPDDTQPTVACAVRLPNGQRIARRFMCEAPVGQLFAFVDARYEHAAPDSASAPSQGQEQGQDQMEEDKGYQLVAQFPRRVLMRPPPTTSPLGLGQVTFDALGLGQGGQELFLLEPL